MKHIASPVLRSGRAPRRLGRQLAWLFALVSACSVYDESLLSRRSSIVTTGGASNGEGGEGAGTGGSGGNSGSGGSAQGGGAGSSSGGGGGSTGGVAGALGAGASSGGASGSTNLGGSSSGGVAMGGSPDAGAGGESGEVGTGGTGGTTGGTMSGGATSGGATSGGASSGGTAGKGGSGSGGSSGSCGGKLSGGICWYVGALNESCEQVCSAHGSVNGAMAGVVGTPTQGGSRAKCQTLVDLFGATVTVFDGARDDGLGLGCHYYDPEIYWLYDPDFTEDAAEVGARLVCGCNR